MGLHPSFYQYSTLSIYTPVYTCVRPFYAPLSTLLCLLSMHLAMLLCLRSCLLSTLLCLRSCLLSTLLSMLLPTQPVYTPFYTPVYAPVYTLVSENLCCTLLNYKTAASLKHCPPQFYKTVVRGLNYSTGKLL